MKSKRLRFGLKSVFALAAIVAFTIPIVQWLRADAIFHANTSFVIRFPDGRTVATNRWVRRTSDFDFTLLATDQLGQFNIIQHNDSSKVATINYDGTEYAALVTDFRVRGPVYRGEYWLTLGNTIGLTLSDTEAIELSHATEPAVGSVLK